jgi:hypothetical protein
MRDVRRCRSTQELDGGSAACGAVLAILLRPCYGGGLLAGTACAPHPPVDHPSAVTVAAIGAARKILNSFSFAVPSFSRLTFS